VIRWCAYCQSFLGESKNYDDYSMSHGICQKCSDDPRVLNKEFIEQQSGVRALYSDMTKAGRNGEYLDAAAILKRAVSIGIKPIDLIYGVLQPSLYEIGELWQANELTVANEHQYTSFACSLIESMFTLYPDTRTYRQSKRPKFLLVSPINNLHTLGISFAELFLVLNNIPVYTICPSLPASHVRQLTEDLKPKYVGVSISVGLHIKDALNIYEDLRDNSKYKDYKFLADGFLVRSGFRFPDSLNIKHLTHLPEVLDL